MNTNVSTTKIPLIVTTSIINKKTYLMTFIAWAIIITDVIFGTFFDALGIMETRGKKDDRTVSA